MKNCTMTNKDINTRTSLETDGFEKAYEVTYKGIGIDLNNVETMPWRQFLEKKREVVGKIKLAMVGVKKVSFPVYRARLRYYSREDPMNVAYMLKIFEDVMRALKIIPNDTKMYCNEISICPDFEIPNNNTFIFELYGYTGQLKTDNELNKG